MTGVLFIGWVVFVFAVSDLVGGALLSRDRPLPASQRPTVGLRPVAPGAHSILLGFAALWVVLSIAYALGVATRDVMAVTIVAAGVASALAKRRHLAGWIRSRVADWAAVGAVSLAALWVVPNIDPFDDPEYFSLIYRLLHTGSVAEVFNFHRPITLGGWTFIQSIFCAGPAGMAFVASIDVVLGAVFFFVCARLLDADVWTAIFGSVAAVLLVEHHQVDLGTAIGMAGMAAVLAGLSWSDANPAADFTAMTVAVMALTVRPQLGLVAMTAAGVVCLRRRSRWYWSVWLAAALAGLWIAIFVRDTSLLPLSVSPGYNPQIATIWADSSAQPQSLAWQLARLARQHWELASVAALAVAVHVRQSLARRRPAEESRRRAILVAFAAAATATVVTMIWMVGARGPEFARYYLPIVEGVLYVCLVRDTVHIQGWGSLATSAWLPAAVTAGALSATIGVSTGELAVPTASSTEICTPPLTSSERRAFDALPGESGYTVLEIACPSDSFDLSPQVVLGDLFLATHGDYFDIASTPRETVQWLQREHIGRLVYLDRDTSRATGLDYWRSRLARDPPRPEWLRREHSYIVKSLEQFRAVADSCPTVRLPIADPQGPLVIVDVGRCEGRTSPGPAVAPDRAGPSTP